MTVALKGVAVGIRAGQIDSTTARTTIQSSLAVALGALGGAGMGILFAALGTFATSVVPNPLLRILGTAGFGAVGLAADWYISDAGIADTIATRLTNALFDGAEALGNTITSLVKLFYDALNRIPGAPVIPDEFSFLMRGEPAQSNPSDGSVEAVVYRDGGIEERLAASASLQVVIPSDWSNTSGDDPKSPWNDPAPI